ncbi:MAG: glycosyltransferase family 4 protein [Actinomycetota bacterium]|nr:glycosyltransferase family 4 protein [Actinomycetota bacterium]
MGAHVLVLVEALPYPFDVRVRAEVRALVVAGYSVTVACPTGSESDRLDETLDGVRIRRFSAPAPGRTTLGYLREYAMSTRRLAQLVYSVQRESPVDLVFVCPPPDALVLLPLPLKRRGAGVLFDFREISPELYEAKFQRRGLLHTLLLWSERLAFRFCDVVITVSEPCMEIARGRGKVDSDRVFLVGNGPDPTRIFQVEPLPELRRGRKHLVLWLGAMSQQEGLGRLVEAADRLVNQFGRKDVLFALVGPGDVHDDLRAEVARRGLEGVVVLSGAVNDELVRSYIATADVCVGVDEQNSMNNRAAMRKIFEYMAMGRPVVQFPLHEMRRLCGEATLYARNADAADLADKIVSLLDNPERAAQLGDLARRTVHEQRLMWPDQIPPLLAAVEKAMGVPR